MSTRNQSRQTKRDTRVQRKEQQRAKQERRRDRINANNTSSVPDDNVVSITAYKQNKQWKAPSNFKALKPNHYKVIDAIRSYPIVILNGPPGCLKTYLSLETSLLMIKEGLYEYIIYARQDIDRPNEKPRGALPGGEAEKFSDLMAPIEDNLRALVPPGELKYILDNVITGSRIDTIRGRSPLDTVIIGDEAQNMDYCAIKCLMTRAPENSMLILVGDYDGQRDINSECFNAFREVCLECNRDIYKDIKVINLTKDDILRNDINKVVLEVFDNIESRRCI